MNVFSGRYQEIGDAANTHYHRVINLTKEIADTPELTSLEIWKQLQSLHEQLAEALIALYTDEIQIAEMYRYCNAVSNWEGFDNAD